MLLLGLQLQRQYLTASDCRTTGFAISAARWRACLYLSTSSDEATARNDPKVSIRKAWILVPKAVVQAKRRGDDRRIVPRLPPCLPRSTAD